MSDFLKTCVGILIGGLIGAVPLIAQPKQSVETLAPTPAAPIAASTPAPSAPIAVLPKPQTADASLSIVKMEVGGEVCTGFFVAPSKLLTADHCFKRSDQAVITLRDGSTHEAQKEKTVAPDVALVTTSYSSKVFLEKGVGVTGVAIDLKGWRLGIWTESKGTLRDKDRRQNWDYSASPLNAPGYSGAPIVQNGKWIGVNVGYKKDTGRNVGIPSEKIEF